MQGVEIASNEIYTVNDIAKLLKLSTLTIQRLAKDGEIPYVKIGSRYRFCGWQLKEWLDSKRM